jgi:hypothetical protein
MGFLFTVCSKYGLSRLQWLNVFLAWALAVRNNQAGLSLELEFASGWAEHGLCSTWSGLLWTSFGPEMPGNVCPEHGLVSVKSVLGKSWA